ncbi:MAG: rod shape-determining protein RodA [bacterium]|nr:rod shape-determining protein RodA [bacterium]
MRQFQDTLRFDFWLFISMFMVCVLGLLGIFSIVYQNQVAVYSNVLIKQILAFAIGLLVIVFYLQLNYPTLKKYALGFYISSIVLLVLVLLIGTKVRGVRSWFVLGLFSFQPSELAKLAFIMFLAKYIEEMRTWKSWRDLFWPMILMLIPVGLILLQPDFGSTLVFFPILVVMLYVGGCQLKYILAMAGFGLLISIMTLIRIYTELKSTAMDNYIIRVIANINYMLVFLAALFLLLALIYFLAKRLKYELNFKQMMAGFFVVTAGILSSYIFEFLMKAYQKKRLVVFLDPYLDPLGAGYNIIQSKIAVGSGGWLGKGLLYGTQSRLGFLPEQHTDFIFSVLAEEFGFAGGALLLILLFIIIWRGIIIVNQARDEFGALVATGIVTMFAFHIFLNIGMTLGIMPITGVPLPLVSYGGSSLVMNMFAIGILLNIRMKRFYY